jgi:dTDP-4-dehydrorhamnose reductase
MTSAETIASTIHALADGAQPSRTYNVYDLGVTSPFRVGQLLAEAGLRKEPQRIDKAELDAWHKPKRVDAVLYDRAFEMLASPPDIEAELRRTINVLKGTKEGE